MIAVELYLLPIQKIPSKKVILLGIIYT